MFIKKLLGIAPTEETDGSYRPSKVALKLATVDTTDYEEVSYQRYSGTKSKILVICTEQKNMLMKNGKLFSTGNHPVETLVPMLHLQNAGFEFEIATPTAQPVVFEMWAFPEKDDAVKTLYKELDSQFKQPTSLADFASSSPDTAESYAAVFIPGGHGSMLGIPEDENVGKVLRWAHKNELFTISLCHGPGAFLATTTNNQPFLYKGYQMCVFPDSVDKQTPMVGYLPGHMPFGLSERLKELGVTLMNSKSDNSVCRDRKLLTGASPLAANELGKMAANALLSEFSQ